MRNINSLAVRATGAAALALLLTVSAFAEDRPNDRTWREGDQRLSRTNRRGSDADRSAEAERSQRERGTVGTAARADARPQAEGRVDRSRDRRAEDARSSRVDDQRRADARVQGNNRGGRDGAYRNGAGNNGRDSYGQYRENARVRSNGLISRYARERGGYRVWLDNAPYAFWIPEARWRNNWRVGININLGGIFRGGMVYADVYDGPYYNDGGYGYDGGYGEYLSGYVDRIDDRSGTVWLRDDRSGRRVAVDMRSVDRRYSRLDSRDLRPGDRVTLTGNWMRNGLFAADRIDSVSTQRY